MSNLSSTQPTPTTPRKARGVFGLVLLGVLVFVALGAFSGYLTGNQDRVNAANTEQAGTLAEQFALAQADLEGGRYDFARQRLEYIISKDPYFEGAPELLTETLFKMSITPSPTVTPTATLTPTPDLREAEAIYNQIRAQMAAGDWDGALASLDALRKSEPGYRIAEIDGMYYMSLRSRGVNKILGQGAYAGAPNLEGGIYDLTLAERFGTLDSLAGGYRTYARLYLAASSYWDTNWQRASELFAQVYAGLPFLSDGTSTATERYREATYEYGLQLYGQSEWCAAEQQFRVAYAIRQDNDLGDLIEEVVPKCSPPTPTALPTATGAPTSTPEPTTESTPDGGGAEPTATPEGG
jgi:tetratricopeptide (TPR) repeat protein